MGSRRLRVLQVLPWDRPSGGVAAVAGNLGRYLTGRGHHVLVFNPGEQDRLGTGTTSWGFGSRELNLRPISGAGSRLRRCAAFAAHLVPTMLRLDGMLRRERIDIINIHYPVAAFFYFAALRRKARRLVVSIHGADLFPDGAPRPSYSWELRTLLRSADRIVAPSRSLLDDFNRVFPDQAARASFIHNGIALEEDIKARRDTAAAPTLLCVAAHNEKKAIDVLLHAFARVCAVRPARLCLIGDGPLHAALVDLAERLGLSDSVEFLGWRSHMEVTRRMADAAVVVLPSRAEPFGLVIAEAMATGAPVVASAVGGIPEIVTDGTDGLLVPPGDPQALAAALLRVVQDMQFGRRLGEQARETVHRRFLVEHMGAAYESLFMSMIHDDRDAG